MYRYGNSVFASNFYLKLKNKNSFFYDLSLLTIFICAIFVDSMSFISIILYGLYVRVRLHATETKSHPGMKLVPG